MSDIDINSDDYWTREFNVTTADLIRIADYIGRTEKADDLGSLVKRVVRGRLRYGRDNSAVIATTATTTASTSVKLWDPVGTWQIGDHAIVLILRKPRVYEALIGEVKIVAQDRVVFHLPSENRSIAFARAEPGSELGRKWHAKVREVAAQKREAQDEAERLDLIVLEYGSHIAEQLLTALRKDERFMLLSGRWFLRELAELPSDEQMAALAWSLLAAPEPQSTEALFDQMVETAAVGDAGLFGLYLALQQRPEVFGNTEPGKRPLWKIVGPPPGSFVPQHAAYDPESYEILCMPGETTQAEVVARLWETELLTAVV